MRITIAKDPKGLGRVAAREMAQALQAAIESRGEASLILSTGASQFDTLDQLTKEAVDWRRVTMFHLDEYVGLPSSHPASFRKYLKERFVEKTPGLKEAVFVDGEGDLDQALKALEAKIRRAPVDVAAIGIGENAHIAFNDPPADFDTDEAYLVVALDEACRRQQVGEGWFKTLEDVPPRAVTMSVRQIMRSAKIFSSVPYPVKARAIARTLTAPGVTPEIPATMLLTHPDYHLFLDRDSASELNLQELGKQPGLTLTMAEEEE